MNDGIWLDMNRELYTMMNRIANVLKSRGVVKGDRVAIYIPVSPIAVASMLACARIGAIHSVVFAGFSAQALASRIIDGMVFSSPPTAYNSFSVPQAEICLSLKWTIIFNVSWIMLLPVNLKWEMNWISGTNGILYISKEF